MTEAEVKLLWRPLKPARRAEVKKFLREIPSGIYGTGRRDVMRTAKQKFGPTLDWATILPLLLKYLPMLLSLL